MADYSLTAQALPDYAEVSSQTAMHASNTHTATSGNGHPEAEQATVHQHPQSEHTGRVDRHYCYCSSDTGVQVCT